LNSQIGSNADKEQTGEWMDDILQEGQNAIMGNGKYEKPEEPQPSDKEEESEEGKGENPDKGEGENEDETEKPDDSQEGSGSGSSSLDLSFEIWDPIKQKFVPLGEYLTLDMVQAEYDKMFDKYDTLTEEDMHAIAAYYAALETAVRQYRTENNLPLYSEGYKQ
jgi:hypothetical protein